VPGIAAEEARATMLELFPEGFEERERAGAVELAAYTDAVGATRLWRAFGEYVWSEVPPDWQDRWREFHRPARVGPLWIGPPWLEPPTDAMPIVIDPGRAFGTGAHPTTRLCLAMLVELGHRSCSLLDIGCGSGVLAIAAAKLGFSPVTALDHDAVTLDATRENAKVNGVAIGVTMLDALQDPLPAAEVAVANISVTIVEAMAGRVDSTLLVTSGYLATEVPAFPGFHQVERRELDGWGADLWKRSA
jgi:ribosomal protein L11 methyltransferase